jgi:hypothetical protein
VQRPAVHIWPAAQTTPHPPQLCVSVFVLASQPSAGLLLQSLKPVLQDWTAQLPARQAAISLLVKQTVPQAPQLLVSVWTFVQAPLHNIWPVEHDWVQTLPVQLPLKHCEPDAQATPFAKRGTQAPAVQVVEPDLQTVPHLPQLLLSLCTFVQAPLQSTWLPVQVAGQAPLVQAWPLGQAVVQEPQLEGSEETLVQNPLQEVPEQRSVSP